MDRRDFLKGVGKAVAGMPVLGLLVSNAPANGNKSDELPKLYYHIREDCLSFLPGYEVICNSEFGVLSIEEASRRCGTDYVNRKRRLYQVICREIHVLPICERERNTNICGWAICDIIYNGRHD